MTSKPHSPRQQNGSGGKFIVCSCNEWRSGVGDQAYVREQFREHIRLLAVPQKACSRPSPFARLTQPQCVAGPEGHPGACEFPGTAGRESLKVNPR